MTTLTEPVQNEKSTTLNSCRLCGCAELDLVSTVDRLKKPLRTVICKQCGLVFTQENRIDDLREFYANDYRGTVKKPPLRHVYRHGKNALERYQHLKSIFTPGQSVLDIGSGNGEFVYLMTWLGYPTKGIEPHQGLASYSHSELGIDIEVNFLEDYARATDDRFDVVTLFHVLEHKDDPVETLTIIHGLLNQNGYCYIEVPDISARCVAPQNVFHIDHIYNFNEETLTLLAERTGFVVDKVIRFPIEGNIGVIFKKASQPKPQSLSSIQNYQTTFRKLKTYTPFKHYLTYRPYLRVVNKGFKRLNERLSIRRFDANARKQLLNELFSQTLGASAK